MQLRLGQLPRSLFLLLMTLGSAMITLSSLAYFDSDALPPFVIEKLPVRFESLWLWSLRVHVTAAAFAFPLCLALMTKFLQRRAAWHRWLGRITGVIVLGALVPSGSVLAFDAKGGAVVTAGFLLSAAWVLWFMARGIVAARRHEMPAHRRAMRHVVAQMSVAVSSRAMLLGFDFAGVAPDLGYVLALWVPVLGSAAAVELLSIRSFAQLLSSLEERTHRGYSSLGFFGPLRSFARARSRFGR